MYRKFEEKLLKWKENPKKPLMLIGARQIGKTYILKEFCNKYFDNNYYVNLELNKDIAAIFENTLEPEKIIEQIEIITGENFDIQNTIFFFDEIQVSEKAITSLKYFCESEKNYKIVCAGSLLGVALNRFQSSFPVGKVELENLYVMDFEEFLLACGEDLLIKEIKEHYISNESLSDPIHEKAIDLYKKYLVLGGMPELILDFISNGKSITHVDYSKQQKIIDAYLFDMNKYTKRDVSIKNNMVYKTIPSVLSRENNTFKFSLVDVNARQERYQSSLDWLEDSGMIIKCNLTERNTSPFMAYLNPSKFKLYLNDIGLLRALANIDFNEILLDKNDMFKGALVENYVAIELFKKYKELYFYKFVNFEIDFLIKINGDVIPVEVKSGKRITSKSLNAYKEKYKPLYCIRISEKNFGFVNNIKSVPLYAVFCINS